jgi:GH24 family phage-related lysozyme (muramidase)
MRTSRRGVAFIAGWEGFVGHAYKPVPWERYWTIGFGHYGPDVRAGQRITREGALELLARDLPRYEAAVNALGGHLTQGQFDALVSLVYNCGTGAVQGRIATLVAQGNLSAIPEVMRRYVHAGGRVLPGLARRREAEIAVFNERAPEAGHDALSDLTATERRWCREYDGLKARDVKLLRRRELRRAMTEARKRIWRAAQKTGWDVNHRRERYHSLLARTT